MDVIIVTMLFGVLGILIGWKVGSVWGASAPDDRRYWLRNLAVVLAGTVLSAVVSLIGLPTLAGLCIGLIGGGITGLKMGYGKSVGIWQKHDRLFRVNRDQVAAARSAEAAKGDGMTQDERARRDLVSVDGDRSRGRDEDEGDR